MSSNAQTRCAACSKDLTTSSRCSGCKSVYYCSPACQKSDWKKCHKQQCKVLTLANEAQETAAKYTADTVKGIRVACSKDPGWADSVDIPSDHAIFAGPLLEVPALMGIPLVMYRLGTQSARQPDLDNQMAPWLNIKFADGFAPQEWQSHVGSCLLARMDKKPLSEEHAGALHEYMSRILDLFGNGVQAGQSAITRERFEKWFVGYKKERLMNGYKEWENVGSLYQV
jgi:hypothetical protein